MARVVQPDRYGAYAMRRCHRGGVRTLAPALLTALLLASTGPARAQTAAPSPVDAACTQASPVAAPCTLADKFAESAAAECRRLGLPDADCAFPIGKRVTTAAVDAFRGSWVDRSLAFQYALGDRLPFGAAQWIGTHNSFNSVNDTPTISHSDSNQQLSLAQQLDVDVRALEIDVHFIRSAAAGGATVPVVCHGQGPDNANAGCTNERTLTEVLPEVAAWANAHPSQVLLLYLEDEIRNDAGYPPTVDEVRRILVRKDGGSMIYRPDATRTAKNGCVPLPLGVSRDEVRRAGAQIVLVGRCAKGWAGIVHDWDAVHVESGSTQRYRPFPACDATYARTTYENELVRYYEDSTFVATAVDPTTPASDPERLTPAKTAAMTGCGVNVFGFDQILPDDGRLEAAVWSWAPMQPDAANPCAVQGTDGRWSTRPCSERHLVACAVGRSWRLSRGPVTFSRARDACRAIHGFFGLPYEAFSNSNLRHAAGDQVVWIAERTSGVIVVKRKPKGRRRD